MYIPFDQMPDHARVWIYQADRPLSDQEVQQAQQQGKSFAAEWAAHGQELRASVTVLHQHFLVIALDEHHHAASGCSIDSSVGLVRSLENSFKTPGGPISFMDRTRVAVLQQDQVQLLPLSELKQQLSSGQLAPSTLTFNNTVATKGALNAEWVVAIGQSWLARYLPKVDA